MHFIISLILSLIGAQGVVICFDLSVAKRSRDINPSLMAALNLKRNLDLESEKRDWPKPPCILVGCKSDLIEYNINAQAMDSVVQVPIISIISTSYISVLVLRGFIIVLIGITMKENGFQGWFETSSRGALNLQKAMEVIVRAIYQREGILYLFLFFLFIFKFICSFFLSLSF